MNSVLIFGAALSEVAGDEADRAVSLALEAEVDHFGVDHFDTASRPRGYDLYCMNVMAGPVRGWKIKNDPQHEWLLG